MKTHIREENRDTDLPGDFADPEAGDAARQFVRHRFRVLRFLFLIILAFVSAFLGMVVNLTSAGWIGVVTILVLLGILSSKASARGCLPTLVVWVTGFLCLLAVVALTARI